MSELLPCPFCGGAVELTSSKTLGDRLFCIKCPNDSPCIGSGLGIYVVSGQVETAIAAWNRRPLHPYRRRKDTVSGTATVYVQPAYGVTDISKDGMATLRAMFPEAAADEMNFVIFSTSGTHGSYVTIEDIEAEIAAGEELSGLTVLIVQPRTVRLLYGTIEIEPSDIPFLKQLRESSAAIMAAINLP